MELRAARRGVEPLDPGALLDAERQDAHRDRLDVAREQDPELGADRLESCVRGRGKAWVDLEAPGASEPDIRRDDDLVVTCSRPRHTGAMVPPALAFSVNGTASRATRSIVLIAPRAPR
jgi:hypothetical protein